MTRIHLFAVVCGVLLVFLIATHEQFEPNEFKATFGIEWANPYRAHDCEPERFRIIRAAVTERLAHLRSEYEKSSRAKAAFWKSVSASYALAFYYGAAPVEPFMQRAQTRLCCKALVDDVEVPVERSWKAYGRAKRVARLGGYN